MIIFISSVLDDPCDRDYILNIYEKYHRLMYSTVWKYVSNKSDCEDLIQECILRMIEKIEYIRNVDSCFLPAYIVSMIRNTTLNHLKRQSVFQKSLAKIASLQSEEELELDEMTHLIFCREQLSSVLGMLTPDERLLLEGKYILGYSDSDLAQCLKCKPNSIRMKLTRTRRKALNLLAQQEGEIND